ncbi:MAG: peptidylprolyl isomerase [Bacteriovoracaceae bacterium]
MRIILTFVLLLNMSLSFSQEKDPVVAVVNGKEIKKSTLYKYHRDNLSFVKSNKKVTLQSSLDDLINRIIGIDKAKKNKLHKNPQVIKKMNDILYHAQISKDLEGELKKIKVSDKEVAQYYKDHPEYRTAQILFRLRTVPSEEEVKETFEKAVKIHNEVTKKPDSFLEYAARFSQSSNAVDGGDLGYQPHTRLTPEYYENIKGKKPDTITAPFRTQYGIHIVKILGSKNAEQINKDMYKKIIYDMKRDKMIENYFAGLRKQSKVKVVKKHLK